MMDGDIRVPTFDEHTPNTALVTVSWGPYQLTIDFIDNVLGLGGREVRASQIMVDWTLPDGTVETYSLQLMHPVDCLISRINSMKHPAIRRSDDFIKSQNAAAFYILRQHISEALSEGDFHEAKHCFRELFDFLARDPIGREAHIGTPIDPLGILETFAVDTRIDERYRQHQLAGMLKKVEKKRASLAAIDACRSRRAPKT